MVTGGAGYIGAHTSLLLVGRGDDVVIVDDLVTGSATRVPGIPIIALDLASDGAHDILEAALREHRIDAVIHFAARKQVGESVDRPAWYYAQNVGGLAQLLLAMEAAHVSRLVFSSSAAVYGDVDGSVNEASALNPVNPYGATKKAGEELITSAVGAWPLSAASLRYFNVGGAGRPELGDTGASNLIPMVFDRLDAGERPEIFGADYPTPDGTCIRDYVHVQDVAEAHLSVLDRLDSAPGHVVLNVGTGVGTSVREVVDAINLVVGGGREPIVRSRRFGDPASVVADIERIRQFSGWTARFGIRDIVDSAWQARQALHSP